MSSSKASTAQQLPPYERRIVRSGVCFRCSKSLQWMNREKGYYAAVVNIDGVERNFHQQCALDELRDRAQGL